MAGVTHMLEGGQDIPQEAWPDAHSDGLLTNIMPSVQSTTEVVNSNELQLVGSKSLILLWNGYQKLGKGVYSTIFKRIIDGDCPVSSCQESQRKNVCL